ncbi:MAG: hypothetical protein J7J52_04810 [Deltaproteobacteria bacterium]|nr:hypothetical protein [Deltaproteobacteria bacterium]
MKDTRETFCSKEIQPKTKPRFKPGDEVLYPWNGRAIRATVSDVFWLSFGGWFVSLRSGAAGEHEQNFISASEEGQWVPHEVLTWSWWTKK